MAVYAVTFRISTKTVNGADYDTRRQRLIDNVRSEDAELGYWEDTTSFFFAESYLDTAAFAAAAVEGLSEAEDKVVIFDPKDMSSCYFGKVQHLDVLRSFLPDAKKAP